MTALALRDWAAHRVWVADELPSPAAARPSGHAVLDAELPGQGWPMGALTELMPQHLGWGEWALTLPTLCDLAGAGRRIVLVGAPWAPYAPGLAARGLDVAALLWVDVADPQARLWAAEQALACADVGAVLLWWSPPRGGVGAFDALRRLQLRVVADASKLLWVVRTAVTQAHPSPAALRLGVTSQTVTQPLGEVPVPVPCTPVSGGRSAWGVQVLKRRGAPCAHALTVWA